MASDLSISNLSPAWRRREKLRIRIIDEATKLYLENGGENGGFEKTMVEAIAERSDISLRTFFRYFESKTDVIYLDIKVAISDLEALLRERLMTETPVVAAMNARLEHVMRFQSSASTRKRMLRSLRAPQFKDRLVVLRSQTKSAITALITPHFRDDPKTALARARMVAAVVTDAAADALDDWALDQTTDVLASTLATFKFLPDIVRELAVAGSNYGGDTA